MMRTMIALLTPDYYLKNVLVLRPEALGQTGIRALLLDIDSTIVHYRSRALLFGTEEWIKSLKQAGIGVCLVSNGPKKRVEQIALNLNIPFVCFAFKPLPFGFGRALRKMQFDRASTACVGDQVFADVLAGHLAGIRTILVPPLAPEEEPWFTALKRPLERYVLRQTRQRPLEHF